MESAILVSYGIRATRLPSSCPQRTRWTLESFQPICPSCRKWKDVVVLQPPDQVMETDPRYRRQFRSDFRVRKGRVITWLHFLCLSYIYYFKYLLSLIRGLLRFILYISI